MKLLWQAVDAEETIANRGLRGLGVDVRHQRPWSALAHQRRTPGRRGELARCPSGQRSPGERRLMVRWGHQKALMAVVHRLLVAIAHLLQPREP
jgi:hypothetical protein